MLESPPYDKMLDMDKRVYNTETISPTVTTVPGGNKEIKIMTLNTKDKDGKEPPQQDRVYNTDGIMVALSAELNGRFNILEPKICAMRGRPKENPKSRQEGVPTEQMLEVKDDGTSNTLTTVQKDNLLTEPKTVDLVGGAEQRIRKLTPKECWRLMGQSDTDFEKAQNAGISNSQLYKMAGNSIVVQVLEAIFREMI